MSSGFFFFLVALIAPLLAVLSLAVISADYDHRKFDCEVPTKSKRLASAEVHYLDWSTLTIEAYDIERVRSIPAIKLARGVRLDCLSSAIATNEMNLPFGSASPRNGRFVLVGETQSGDRVEVYADRFSICSLSDNLCRENDEQTRARISFILKAHAL